jgi:hypothetical protein
MGVWLFSIWLVLVPLSYVHVICLCALDAVNGTLLDKLSASSWLPEYWLIGGLDGFCSCESTCDIRTRVLCM